MLNMLDKNFSRQIEIFLAHISMSYCDHNAAAVIYGASNGPKPWLRKVVLERIQHWEWWCNKPVTEKVSSGSDRFEVSASPRS